MTNTALELLEEALRTDAAGTEAFIKSGTPCNENLARHPDIIVRGDGCLTALGLLNSFLVKSGHSKVAAVLDDNGKLLAFREVF